MFPPRLPFFGAPLPPVMPLESVMRGFEQWLRITEPVARSVMCANLEIGGLTAKRMRAWLELPREIAECTSPPKLMAAQVRFWQAAIEDRVHTAKRLQEIMVNGLVPALGGPNGEAAAASARDVMSLGEPARPQSDGKPEEAAGARRRNPPLRAA